MSDVPDPMTSSLLALILSHLAEGWAAGMWLALSMVGAAVFIFGVWRDWGAS